MRIVKSLIVLLFLVLFATCTTHDSDPLLTTKDASFFLYSGNDPGMKDLILYLQEIDEVTPFISEFQKNYGNPVWDIISNYSNGDDWNIYVPIKHPSKEEITTLWHFSFLGGKVTYYPIVRDRVEKSAPEFAWMFDYFNQFVLGKRNDENLTFVPVIPDVQTKTWYEVTYVVETWVGTIEEPFRYLSNVRIWTEARWVSDGSNNTVTSQNLYKNGAGGAGGSAYTGVIPSYARTYSYPELNIYHSNSTLDTNQKNSLNIAIENFKTLYPQYAQLLQMLTNRRIQIVFKVDASIPGLAAYIKDNQSIAFQSPSTILTSLDEEIIHAVQHLCYYGNIMDTQYKNFEYEAKVFRDLSRAFTFGEASGVFLGADEAMNDAYFFWLEDMLYRNRFDSSDMAQFNDFCNQWSTYPGITIPDFEPQLIQRFFGQHGQPPIY